jgi:diguanylate cyclase (GGDEF)-like protein
MPGALKACAPMDDICDVMQSDVAGERRAGRSAPLDVESLVRSGRLAAGLIAVLGVVTPVGQWAVGALTLTAAVCLSAAGLVVAAIVMHLPWSTFSSRASLVPVLLALVLLGIPLPMPVAGYLVLLPLYSVVFLYVGLAQPPGTALRLAPVGALSVFLPLVVVDQLFVAVPAGLALVTAVLTGEILARHLAANRQAWEVTKGSLTGLASLLDSATVDEARDRLGASLALLLDSAVVTVTLDTGADHPPPPAPASGGELLVLPLRVALGDGAQDLGVVEIRVPTGHADRQQREEVAAAGILIGEAAKILLRLQEAETLAYQAGRDPLTGLANRRTFAAQVADTAPGDVLAMLDLDHFKRVNDTLGHAEGDHELVRLAEALDSFARPGDCVARVGGEEFAVLLRAVTPDDAAAWIERVRTFFRPRAATTFSAGLAVHRAADPPADTLRRADAALYEAKRGGRDRTCHAEPAPALATAEGAGQAGQGGGARGQGLR